MKTDNFEKIIRGKLESITPDFQEDDWAKMQNYMHAHTPPGLWQQYGSWLGYAAAASVTTVMAFLYIGQLSRTQDLASDVKMLQSQIEVIKNAPSAAAKTDTIYIVQKEVSKDQFFDQKITDFQQEQTYAKSGNRFNDPAKQSLKNPERNDLIVRSDSKVNENTSRSDQQKTYNTAFAGTQSENNTNSGYKVPAVPESMQSTQLNESENTGKALDNNFDQLSELDPVQIPDLSRKMNYSLANRLSGKQVKKFLLANNSVAQKSTIEDKKTERTAKAENTIPRLNLKVPYRFGGGIQFEGNNQVKSVLGEVLVTKRIAISTGFSWVKIKPMEFFTEKIFREKNRKDFKRSHPNEVPVAFEVLNIKVNPTLVQIPLTVAFRNDVKNDFSYYASAGTNITVKGREQIGFDCRLPMPGQEFKNQSFEKKMDIPAINSLNVSVGIEKSWYPIVVQAEAYMYNYFKPISRESARTGPGVKLKLLYQIGRKM